MGACPALCMRFSSISGPLLSRFQYHAFLFTPTSCCDNPKYLHKLKDYFSLGFPWFSSSLFLSSDFSFSYKFVPLVISSPIRAINTIHMATLPIHARVRTHTHPYPAWTFALSSKLTLSTAYVTSPLGELAGISNLMCPKPNS